MLLTGVTAVGNIGNERCNFKVAAIGAYLSLPLYYTEPSALFYGACTSAVALNWKGKEWRREYSNNKHVCKRFLTLVFACSIYTSLWTSALYHNAYVTIDHGDKVKLKEVIGNFFNSPAWAEMKHTMWKLYDEVKRNGWDSMWEQLVREMDPEGELNAYKVNMETHKLIKHWNSFIWTKRQNVFWQFEISILNDSYWTLVLINSCFTTFRAAS